MEKHQLFEGFVKQIFWAKAKTYEKTAPHEYSLAKWMTRKEKLILKEFAKHIQDFGYIEYFYNTPYRYYDIGKKKYWIMEKPEKVTLINRTNIENRYGMKNDKDKEPQTLLQIS